MIITPLEIRQKVFEKAFRGYDKDEVTAFLNSLSLEWERVHELNKELKYKLESSEKEVLKLREVESSLFKTLKTAEETGASMVEQANKTAELHMRETEMKADALMSEAKSRARSIIEEAEAKAREIVGDMEERAKELMQEFKELHSNKASLVSDLRLLGQEIMEKVNRYEKESVSDVKPHLGKVKDLSQKVKTNKTEERLNEITTQVKEEFRNNREEFAKKSKKAVKAEEPVAAPHEKEPPTTGKENKEGSFFDQFD